MLCIVSSYREEEAEGIKEAGNLSQYHNQVVFINNFLLSTGLIFANTTVKQNNSNADTTLIEPHFKIGTTTRNDNRTAHTDLQVPAVFSSVIDTLPVHFRIPRGSNPKRRRNRLRHSTRVYTGQPSRFLLPPFQNQILQVYYSSFPTESSDEAVAATVSSFTPLVRSTTNSQPPRNEIETEEKESFQNSVVPQNRKVFIPPPLKYLLPPFFYENYNHAHPSTTQSPLLQDTTYTLLVPNFNNNFTSNDLVTPNLLYPNYESSSRTPTTVVEPISETLTWNSSTVKYTTIIPTNHLDHKERLEIVDHLNYGYVTTSPPTNLSVTPPAYAVFTTETVNSTFNRETHFVSNSLPNISQHTTPLTSQLPILSGPNIEETLFETGNFHNFDTQLNESDKTLIMMNRPLLSQEVAQAGMKITANMNENLVKNKKINTGRGRLKYNHLNQFNFEKQDSKPNKSTGVKSLQLLVAETSYYNNRRPQTVKQLSEEAGEFIY